MLVMWVVCFWVLVELFVLVECDLNWLGGGSLCGGEGEGVSVIDMFNVLCLFVEVLGEYGYKGGFYGFWFYFGLLSG